MNTIIGGHVDRILKLLSPEDREWIRAYIALRSQRAEVLRSVLPWPLFGVGAALTIWAIWLAGGWLRADAVATEAMRENDRLRDICVERLLIDEVTDAP